MRCMHGITQQNDIAMMPVLGLERGEADPLRVIRKQLRAMQMLREQILAVGKALYFVGLIQPSVEPGDLVAFDQEGAGRAAIRVSMDLEEAVLVLAEYEGEGVEHLVCPQPD